MVIVSEHTFDQKRIHKANDWLRREIAAALDLKKIIVPLYINNCLSPIYHELPENIRSVKDFPGFSFSRDSFDEEIAKLANFIKKKGIKNVDKTEKLKNNPLAYVLFAANEFRKRIDLLLYEIDLRGLDHQKVQELEIAFQIRELRIKLSDLSTYMEKNEHTRKLDDLKTVLNNIDKRLRYCSFLLESKTPNYQGFYENLYLLQSDIKKIIAFSLLF